MSNIKKFILIILDGYGLRKESHANAAILAETPNLDYLNYVGSTVKLETSGAYVGLPDGVMGNSEVGHTNIGAGRIVKQDLVRINDAIKSNEFKNIPTLNNIFQTVIANHSTLHLNGLFSDAGVHSHLDHLKEILILARDAGVPKAVIHAITDGRDTSPTSGIKYMTQFCEFLEEIQFGSIATVCGRYYAMDRDTRWERTQLAYDMLVSCQGDRFDDPLKAITESYDIDITDEFITPKIISDGCHVTNGDGFLMFNFRADRMRQMITAFIDESFDHFDTNNLDLQLLSMSSYSEKFTFPVLFPSIPLTNIFPEVLDRAGYRQLRIAETEKYAHVTYFMNGGDEKVFPHEKRILIPSPRVATYDLQPEMSAVEVCDNVIESIESETFETIILNFANPDMVGHTGNLDAAITALQTVDNCVGRIIKSVKKYDWTLFLTADHGNLEMMQDPVTGKPHTAHTTLPVPFILFNQSNSFVLNKDGKLADIAPTILEYIELQIPDEMNGVSLLMQKS
jgi:2,3-bisphosphoglycerate-independent phosphoglycerate mutase